MLRFLTLFLSLLATSAFACNESAPSLQIREALYANDIDLVEQLLGENQDLFEAGLRTADDTRCLFRHFTKMRPTTYEFVDAWRAAYPDSPYAHTAKAWVNYVVSWPLRGDGYVHQTYPAAISEFTELQRSAWQHAEIAYLVRPRLIAASDALIKLANPNGKFLVREDVLKTVMTTDPNLGTLNRAKNQVLPNWGVGNNWQVAAAMCESYADHVPHAKPDAVMRCKLPLADRYREHWDWLMEALATDAYPEFDYLRLYTFVRPDASAEDAARAYNIMSGPWYTYTRYLTDYDALALKYDLPLLTASVTKRRHDFAATELAHSPLSLELLKRVSEPVLRSSKDEAGRLHVKVLSRPTAEMALDYAQRRILAEPYSPEAWTELLTQLMRSGQISNLKAGEPYRENAIVYSNHNAETLRNYLYEKIYENDAYLKMLDGKLDPEVEALFEGYDEVDDTICPLIRVVKLHDAVCSGQQKPGCTLDSGLSSSIAWFEAEAKERVLCIKERMLPASMLTFQPMPLPQDAL